MKCPNCGANVSLSRQEGKGQDLECPECNTPVRFSLGMGKTIMIGCALLVPGVLINNLLLGGRIPNYAIAACAGSVAAAVSWKLVEKKQP